MKIKEITTDQLRKDFEQHYNHTYGSDHEFVLAVEAEYRIEENENGEQVFSAENSTSDAENFIVTDWYEDI